MINRQGMVEMLIEEFPGLEEDITDENWAGLVHLEASSFARYTQRQVDQGDKVELKRCFEVARKLVLEGDESIENAMHVSYLEHLNLRDGKIARSWALDLLPEPLSSGYSLIFTTE